MPKEPPEREFVQSLAKGLHVIEAFGADTPAMTLSEVARKAGLTPGSARRVLVTLQSLGYVAERGNRFSLLPRALRLGYAYLASMPLATIVQPRLTQLTQEIGLSCSLAMLDSFETVIVARSTATSLAQDYVTVGGRLPAHAGALGNVLLAALPDRELTSWLATAKLMRITPNTVCDPAALLERIEEVRAARWAFNDQEALLGLRSLAVPVDLLDGGVAALGFSAEVSRAETETLISQYLPALQRAAVSLTELLKARL